MIFLRMKSRRFEKADGTCNHLTRSLSPGNIQDLPSLDRIEQNTSQGHKIVDVVCLRKKGDVRCLIDSDDGSQLLPGLVGQSTCVFGTTQNHNL